MDKKWVPSLITVGLGVLGVFTPQIQGAVAAHPNLAIGLGTAYAVLKGILPSPVSEK